MGKVCGVLCKLFDKDVVLPANTGAPVCRTPVQLISLQLLFLGRVRQNVFSTKILHSTIFFQPCMQK